MGVLNKNNLTPKYLLFVYARQTTLASEVQEKSSVNCAELGAQKRSRYGNVIHIN